MLIDFIAIASWMVVFAGMLYVAIHPDAFGVARRALASDAVTDRDVKFIYALALGVIAISGWSGFVTGNWRLAAIFISIAIALSAMMTIVRRTGWGPLARKYLMVRLVGVAVFVGACFTWTGSDHTVAIALGTMAAATIAFPKQMSVVWGVEDQGPWGAARLRMTGSVGAVLAGGVVLLMIYWTVRGYLVR
jgi:hypothetical protein